jgi:hypothetical protein
MPESQYLEYKRELDLVEHLGSEMPRILQAYGPKPTTGEP